MPPVGLEPTISAGDRPQTYALDGAATGTDLSKYIGLQIRMTINFCALFKVFTIITNRLGPKLKATCDVPKSEDFKFAILV